MGFYFGKLTECMNSKAGAFIAVIFLLCFFIYSFILFEVYFKFIFFPPFFVVFSSHPPTPFPHMFSPILLLLLLTSPFISLNYFGSSRPETHQNPPSTHLPLPDTHTHWISIIPHHLSPTVTPTPHPYQALHQTVSPPGSCSHPITSLHPIRHLA